MLFSVSVMAMSANKTGWERHMQQGIQRQRRMAGCVQHQIASQFCLHLLRLPNRLTIGVQAAQVHYEKIMFSVTCFKRLVW